MNTIYLYSVCGNYITRVNSSNVREIEKIKISGIRFWRVSPAKNVKKNEYHLYYECGSDGPYTSLHVLRDWMYGPLPF
jgi:hypothetical protein